MKSEAEIKEGKRHGRYREYYENGKLKFRGKYANNQPKGTWKYYTEEGEFERKENSPPRTQSNTEMILSC